ncbi:unnamed protein product [Ectocarpus sp. 6 AP-2014]
MKIAVYLILTWFSVISGAPGFAGESRDTVGGDLGSTNFSFRDGALVQGKGCPQAISENEARARATDDAWPGGVTTLSKATLDSTGRSGNHFVVISRALSMAFCCQYKVLTLPSEDSKFPTEDGSQMQLPRHQFSFSSGGRDVPTLPGAEDLPFRPDVCPPEKEINGTYDFFREVHDDLRSCMGNVFLLGCEAHYLHALVGTGGDDDVCSEPHRSLEEEDPLDSQAPGISLRAPGHLGRNDSANVHVNGEENAGTLVIHIRSGDIFKPEKEGWHGMIWYGQPPLLFYEDVMSSAPWAQVVIISNANGEEHQLNPTFEVLEDLASRGLLQLNVTTHRDRPFSQDLRDLICAENLVVADSSLTKLLLHHSRAKRFFVPVACDETLLGSTNITSFCKYRPASQLFGIEWRTSSKARPACAFAYSPYNSNWKRSDSQMLEMIQTREVQAIRRCCESDN